MKDEPNIPLETVGDGPLEARIVAVVLGEASAFEIAEVERLCRERPEILVFQQRIRSLHGLLKENACLNSGADEAWKLPAEKRKLLESMSVSVTEPPIAHSRWQRKSGIALFAVAACATLVASVMHFRPKKFDAVATLEIKPQKISMQPFGSQMAESAGDRSLTPQFYGTEFEKIKSRNTLEKVVDNLDLENRWNVDKDKAVEILKQDVAASNIKGTDLVEIRVRNADEQAAKEIAGEVSRIYQKDRAEVEAVQTERALAELKKAVRDQEDKVEERRKVLSTIVRSKGIVYTGDDSFYSKTDEGTREDAIKRGLDAQDYVDAKRDFETDQALLQQMKLKLIGEQIASNMPTDSIVLHDVPETRSRSAPSARDALASNSLRRVESESAPAPAAAPAKPRVIAANEPAPTSIPVPAEDASANDADYADGASFKLAAGATPSASEGGQIENPLTGILMYRAAAPAGEGEGEGEVAQSALTERAEELSKVGKKEEARALLEGELGKDKENQEAKDALAALDAPIRTNPAMTHEHLRQRKEKAAIEYEIEAGYTSEYLFKGSPLAEEAKPVVKQPVFDFSLETLATDDPYSTFSLHISDASFQLAKAALDKGEQPDPASIKAEQFYNAVDYGDPAPTSNEPVAGFIEQSPHPVIPGRQLVRVAVKTAAAGRSAAQPLRLTLLVDASGSMVRDDRRAAMDMAMEKLAGLLGPADRVNVIGFSRTPRLLAQDLPGDQAQKLTDLVNTEASEGGTNLEESIRLAAEIAIRSKTPGAQNRIVLFTDGAANLGNADPARLAERVKALRQQGVSFDVAGVGADELNDGLLAELARHGDGRYQIIGGKEDGDAFARRLAGAFRPAAENVKVQVRFNPERVASYRLIGFEEHRLKTEDFRNDAVDAAELATEEAGVAIYQVQTLPEGNGEIGELSVRFRDAAAGGMVERNWTISHDPKSPAFDQATPSMQLAALSMLAAEKLKGGPLADAIRFEDFAKIRAEVKRFYGDSPRVNDMLGVIDRLR